MRLSIHFMDLLEAVGSKNFLKGDKKLIKWIIKILTKYLEVGLDIKEGADFVMVKPECHI